MTLSLVFRGITAIVFLWFMIMVLINYIADEKQEALFYLGLAIIVQTAGMNM